jgi:hypothetical protein
MKTVFMKLTKKITSMELCLTLLDVSSSSHYEILTKLVDMIERCALI